MASVPPESTLNGYTAVREPEILPPDAAGYVPAARYAPPAGSGPAAAPVRRRKSVLRAAPATHLLVGINCAVYLAMVARGISAMNPTVDQLMNWGANNAGAVLIYGEWWRIVSAMFLHVGILHLATNMWCLWNLGMLAEPLIGSVGLFAAYILTGAAGNLLSTLVNWVWPIRDAGQVLFPAGAGASGAVFGIAGLLIILLKSPHLPYRPWNSSGCAARSFTLPPSIWSSVYLCRRGNQFVHSGLNIDNMAHMGGFSCGLLFADAHGAAHRLAAQHISNAAAHSRYP